MEQTRKDHGYVDYTLADFCEEVGRPVIPSPAGGAVIGVVGALLASLTELVARVSEKHGPELAEDSWSAVIAQARELNEKFLRFAEEDTELAAKLIRGEGPACVRKQLAVPAKIASGLVKILRLVEGMTDRVHRSVLADLCAIAYLGRGAADAIFEIEKCDVEWGGGGDDILMARIEEWHSQAHEAVDRILHKVREKEWQK